MGNRANIVLVDRDSWQLRYSHWAGCRMLDALLAGPDMAERYIRAQEVGKFVLCEPVGDGPVHRFARGSSDAETIDVMVADRLCRNNIQRRYAGKFFAVPGGASALCKTVNCEVTAGEVVVVLSIPDVLGALVLKGPRDDPGHPHRRAGQG